MPSDPRVQLALDAMRGPIQSFRSALSTTKDQVESYLAAQTPSTNGQVGRLSAELGPFAEGHVDVGRLTSLLTDAPAADPRTLEGIAEVGQTLADLAGRGEDLFVVDVSPGDCLRDAVAKTLAEIGRGFGAARVFELCRANGTAPSGQTQTLSGFPFRRWGKSHRRLAPPLVVLADGGDLHAEGLAEFLDGAVKFVLVVRGESPPAPLVRLITPDTFVVQTADATGLDRLAAWTGPGIAAIVPDGAALFVHDPAAGPALSERLTVTAMPDEAPRKALGGRSAAQQAEELRQLKALASAPAPPAGAAAAPAGATAAAGDPVDRLASWLISQAGL